MPEEPILIACACDERYAPGLAVTVRSLLDCKTDPRPVHLYVLGYQLSATTRAMLLQSWTADITVQILEPEYDRFLRCNLRSGVSPAIYFRLLLPELLPGKRALYLDSDLLVLRDIGELWDTDLQGAPIGAVQELANPTVGDPFGLPAYRDLGLPADQPYINSGVLLFDLAQWREEGLTEQILTYAECEREKVLFWDQDGLNAIVGNRAQLLDPRWNSGLESLRLYCPWQADTAWKRSTAILVEQDPWIIHFLLKKPWEERLHHRYAHPFETCLNQTAFGRNNALLSR
jgi:lipopolysaccharide biosynthesis glycosyltransferase